MNFSVLNIIIALVGIIAVLYVINIVRKKSGKGDTEADDLKKSLKPITDEIETQRVAKFMKYWKDKFEHNNLSVADVKELNATIAEGGIAQVNGILSLHPEAKAMYNQINGQLILEEEAKAAALKEEEEVLA